MTKNLIMKIFVINLETEQVRMKKMEQQLNSLGFVFERIPAVNGGKLSQDKISELYDEKKAVQVLGRKLRLAEIGCSASHMLIYRKIIEENISISLVIEDDAIISPKIKDLYDAITSDSKMPDRDYLSINYTNFDRETLKVFWKHLYENQVKKMKPLTALFQWVGSLFFTIIDWSLILLAKIFGNIQVSAYKPTYLTWGYFITLKWAQKLLSLHPKIFLPSDVFIEHARQKNNFNFWINIPMLIKQNTTLESSIQIKKSSP